MEVFIHREVERNLVNTSLPTTHFSNCCCCCLVAQLCLTPGTAAHQGSVSPRILGWVAISFQGIFLTSVANPCVLRWQDSSPLNNQGSPALYRDNIFLP